MEQGEEIHQLENGPFLFLPDRRVSSDKAADFKIVQNVRQDAGVRQSGVLGDFLTRHSALFRRQGYRGLGLAFALGGKFCAIAGIYVAMQFAYTLLLKRVALLDVVVIAIGFVMRAIAGAVAIKVDISPWLVLCTFFISLFLALCKRRQEKVIHAESEQRHSVKGYGVTLLNLLISIAATSTIIAYSLYTVSAETVAKFGTRRLGATIPFVVFGVFRYLYLVFTEKQGERPEQTLLSDAAILVTVALYLTAFATVLALR